MKAIFFLLVLACISFSEECKSIKGYASWYGEKFHGRKKANGEIFNMYKYTAASNILPINSYVLVRNLDNGKEVLVRITDKGPLKKGRILDLSKSSAEKLGMIRKGIVKVEVLPVSCVAKNEQMASELISDIIKTY